MRFLSSGFSVTYSSATAERSVQNPRTAPSDASENHTNLAGTLEIPIAVLPPDQVYFESLPQIPAA